MKHVLVAVLAVPFLATAAQAVPTQAGSFSGILHSYTVNGGSVPEGVELSIPGNSLTLLSDTSTAFDDPAAETAETVNTVIANPFEDPPIPFEALRIEETSVPGIEGARAAFDVEILSRDDPDADPLLTSIVEREVNSSGSALVNVTSSPRAASAASRFTNERLFEFVNDGPAAAFFDITGLIDLTFATSFEGTDGFARASGAAYLSFENVLDTDVIFTALGPYDPSLDEIGPGALATANLRANDDGIRMSGGASSLAGPGLVQAFSEVELAYRFGITMQAGGSFNLRAGFTHINIVDYAPLPAPAPIPLPAGGLMLLGGLGTLLVTRRAGFGRGRRGRSFGNGPSL